MKKTKMLKKNYEYKEVLSKGKYFSGKNIEVFIKKNSKKYNLLGLAISTKICKAVGRNRIKRLIRENYKIFENDLKDGISMVFLWKKNADTENANFTNIQNDMKYIFCKANIFKDI